MLPKPHLLLLYGPCIITFLRLKQLEWLFINRFLDPKQFTSRQYPIKASKLYPTFKLKKRVERKLEMNTTIKPSTTSHLAVTENNVNTSTTTTQVRGDTYASFY